MFKFPTRTLTIRLPTACRRQAARTAHSATQPLPRGRSAIGGVGLAALNAAELDLLFAVRFDLVVLPDELARRAARVGAFGHDADPMHP